MEEQKHNKVNQWLEGLQRESWQLELIVSAFTIFLLLQLAKVLPDVFPEFNLHTNFSYQAHTTIINFLAAGFFTTFALLINLILHIFFRGFWIAAIGLRSVQRETDFEKLNYSPYFTDKLKRLVPSLEQLIIRLDNLASVVFAFAYLLLFMFMSFALWALFYNTLALIIEALLELLNGGTLAIILWWMYGILMTLIFLVSVVYFLDTLSLGFFKKYQKISKIYYPVYRFLGWITLAGIYRSIYHSLVSRFPKNIVRLLLFLFLFVIALSPFHRITFYKYFPDHTSNAKMIWYSAYDNLRGENKKIGEASITSDIVNTEYLPLFIRYNVKDNEVLDSLCTDYTPTKSSIFVTGIKRGLNDPYYAEEDADKLLDCLSQLYNVYVNDSLCIDLDVYFYSYPDHKTRGLRTMIYTGNLPVGKNTIRITKQQLNKKKKMYESDLAKIPFWLESRQE